MTMSATTPALALRNVSKSFGATEVLHDISLAVERGAFCILLGPSGCGKSTALRCVAGLETPQAGEILIEGQSVIGREPGERNLAMVFQSYALYPHMSIYRNLEFPLKMRRTARRSERHKRIHEVAALLQIEECLKRKPRQLSGGQRQRVAIGRALMREPALFLFDEPLSNLDARLRGEMRVELARLHRTLGATMLYVTHDQVEAMTLGTQIVVMNEGRIEQVGTPRAVYAQPATRFVASFVGTPPMNLLRGRIEGHVFVAEGVRAPLPEPLLAAYERADTPAEIELGVRPEHLEAASPRGSQEGTLTGELELVEDLGADRYAYLSLGASQPRVIARLAQARPATVAPPPAGPATQIETFEPTSSTFRLPAEHLHLFVNGRRLQPSEEREPASAPAGTC